MTRMSAFRWVFSGIGRYIVIYEYFYFSDLSSNFMRWRMLCEVYEHIPPQGN
jgi:hypothetical protein